MTKKIFTFSFWMKICITGSDPLDGKDGKKPLVLGLEDFPCYLLNGGSGIDTMIYEMICLELRWSKYNFNK